MRLALPIHAYAAAGAGAEGLPAARVVALPEPAGARGGGRLPRLALELARRCLGERVLGERAERTAVLFGTAFGCLSETEAFVAHMLREHEATPKPRAFSSSVHNASASFVALKLGARGECSTFVHGELSCAHALLAAAIAHGRSGAPCLAGAADEAPALTFAELARAAGMDEREEGGALFLAGAPDARPLAILEGLVLARPAEPERWAWDELRAAGVDVLLDGTGTPRSDRSALGRTLALRAHHPSSLATATAQALALLAGEVPSSAFGLDRRPARLGVCATTRRREAALLVLRRGE